MKAEFKKQTKLIIAPLLLIVGIAVSPQIAAAAVSEIPINLAAVAGETSIKLFWNYNLRNAMNFIVQRAEDPDFNVGTRSAVAVPGAISFIDFSPKVGKTYYYRVLAGHTSVFSPTIAAIAGGFGIDNLKLNDDYKKSLSLPTIFKY